GGPVDTHPPTTSGSIAYVTDEGCTGAIAVVDLDHNVLAGQVLLPENQFGSSTSFEVAFAPDGTRAYVSGVVPKGGDPGATPGAFLVVDVGGGGLVRAIALPGAPGGGAGAPAGKRVFVSYERRPPAADLHEVAVIDTATGAVLAHVPVGHAPRGLALSP